ncbi:MAG: flagellar biosynthetic protein FliR [Nitrospirae bacterium]|nr:flagellar biosynthetic protein FliR [Nitrospirota bacterium]
MAPIAIDQRTLEIFALVLFRISGILFVSPVLGARNVPIMVKTGLSTLFAFLIYPTLPADLDVGFRGLPDLLIGLAGEFMLGATLGLVADFFFSGVEMAGQWLGMQIGFGMANVLDPQGERQVTILAQIKIMIAFMLFLLVDGHHMIFRSVAESFRLVPLLHARFHGAMVEYLFDLAGGLFVLGVKIAAPVMGVLMVVEVAMALVARTVPQMNILMVGMPVKVLLGVFAVSAMIPVTTLMILKNMPQVERHIADVLKLMGR